MIVIASTDHDLSVCKRACCDFATRPFAFVWDAVGEAAARLCRKLRSESSALFLSDDGCNQGEEAAESARAEENPAEHGRHHRGIGLRDREAGLVEGVKLLRPGAGIVRNCGPIHHPVAGAVTRNQIEIRAKGCQPENAEDQTEDEGCAVLDCAQRAEQKEE